MSSFTCPSVYYGPVIFLDHLKNLKNTFFYKLVYPSVLTLDGVLAMTLV
jgi:hypothetical protein